MPVSVVNFATSFRNSHFYKLGTRMKDH
jgi:hypothetical protein